MEIEISGPLVVDDSGLMVAAALDGTFRVTELGPGVTTPMHRTLSTDYCVVVSGELELLLDGEETIKLLPGETVVQRGTKHAWRNPSRDTPCKFIVCMIEALPVSIAGATLPEES
jgi:quercetin dioxygenase-like cupin family protein